ncbi:hypothetical protein ACOSP7_024523 [Xanthoceras sorbifolium]
MKNLRTAGGFFVHNFCFWKMKLLCVMVDSAHILPCRITRQSADVLAPNHLLSSRQEVPLNGENSFLPAHSRCMTSNAYRRVDHETNTMGRKGPDTVARQSNTCNRLSRNQRPVNMDARRSNAWTVQVTVRLPHFVSSQMILPRDQMLHV